MSNRGGVAKTPVTMEMPIQNHITITRNNLQEKSTMFQFGLEQLLQLSATEPRKKWSRPLSGELWAPVVPPGSTFLYPRFRSVRADFCAAPLSACFLQRGDVIVADDQVSLLVQNALQLSRSTVYYFNHNDMNSLECLLNELTEQERNLDLPAIPRKLSSLRVFFHNS
ncbi:CGH_1_HP_G0103480.mRNA.1.CDS.1 [Saccharomyces cerevisiae]|nr:CGH_1_HP_G0103480.mRNA.1.CDS.1 [Saccharomyces cerevisiae]CAI6950637.1 CGH_1_HP_G0103480.mRNA.1.CDS.1 [Saccharomyces cerevisiae]